MIHNHRHLCSRDIEIVAMHREIMFVRASFGRNMTALEIIRQSSFPDL